MPPSASAATLDLFSGAIDGRRPASFWRFAGSPPPGSGRTPVLAVAGLGLDGRVFSTLAPLAAGRDLVLVNLPNELPSSSTMEDMAAVAMEALDAAGHAGRPAVILGSSFGGMVALAAALARPERTAALVRIGTAPSWALVSTGLRIAARLHGLIPRRAYPRVFSTLMLPPSRYGNPKIREGLRVQMFHRTKGFMGACLESIRGFDATPRLGGIRAPTLILHGDDDPVLPPPAGAAMAAGIPGAVHVRIPSCGHLPHVSLPDFTAECVGKFLAERGL